MPLPLLRCCGHFIKSDVETQVKSSRLHGRRIGYPSDMLWDTFLKYFRTSDIEHVVSNLFDYRDSRVKNNLRPVAQRFADHMRDLLYILTSPNAVMVYG